MLLFSGVVFGLLMFDVRLARASDCFETTKKEQAIKKDAQISLLNATQTCLVGGALNVQ